MTQHNIRKSICIILLCFLFGGCTTLKGGDYAYGTITAKRFVHYLLDGDCYEVNVDADDGNDIRYGEVDKATYDKITFGSRVKMTYTGFDNDWIISPMP